jgi:hypothetical protein
MEYGNGKCQVRIVDIALLQVHVKEDRAEFGVISQVPKLNAL